MKFDIIITIAIATAIGAITSFFITRALEKRYPEVQRPQG